MVHGVESDLIDEGTGLPVVFSHGGSSDRRYWDPQRSEFGARHRFVAFSRRYHGAGPWPDEGDNSDDAHVSDLVHVIRGLDAGPVHVVGFSTAVTLRAAMREPTLVRSLTVVEPNVPWLLEGDSEGEAVTAWWRAENDRVRSEAGGSDRDHARLWFELVNNRGPGTFDAQPATFQDMWLENFTRTRPAVSDHRPITCGDLASITAPTLVLAAEHGMPYSRRIAERVASCVPGAALVVLPGVTHFMSHQDPGRFNDAVLAFIAAH